MEFIIDEKNYFSRIDKFLRKNLPNVPLNEIYKLLRTGKIYINGKRVKEQNFPLEVGDLIKVEIELSNYSRKKEYELKPKDIKLDIIYEDENIVVINKGPNLSVQPGKGVGTSVIEGLLYYGEKKGFEPFLVHRLDKNTSGVLIVAQSRKVARYLGDIIASREVEKRYVTLVIGRSTEQIIEYPVDDLPAKSIIKVKKNFITHLGEFTLLDVEIETGRKHQIRKHLAAVGTPVIGDDTYGDFKINREFKRSYGLKRQFLHCQSMKLSFDGKRIEFFAPLSKDLEEVIEKMERDKI